MVNLDDDKDKKLDGEEGPDGVEDNAEDSEENLDSWELEEDLEE